ncbi:hypothetical protein KIN20_001780 [Parelaphostrongylus tenuis]|uniref:Uncharacterized protein n=1 Tax=Parelaphostrongylus tenuis TaxID=148309 RepID=A0AAD5LYV2_PARTN|nr:hypothetical protein KIN20_001780 [Parelaphostrongylus tenuis]
MLQGLVLNADEDTGNESDASMDKNVHIPQGSEDSGDGDDEIDDMRRALLNVDIVVGDWVTNVQPPTIMPFDDPAAAVQHSILIGCLQPDLFCKLLMVDI